MYIEYIFVHWVHSRNIYIYDVVIARNGNFTSGWNQYGNQGGYGGGYGYGQGGGYGNQGGYNNFLKLFNKSAYTVWKTIN